MQSYVHWLKIHGMGSTRNELKQYQEIQSYIDRYPDAKATMFLYDYNLFDRVVKLECHQNWNDLDLMANSMSHSLQRLTQKPNNIGQSRPFKTPEWLNKTIHRHTPEHSER